MKTMGQRAAAIALGLMFAASPALAATSLGIYQSADGKMDFELIACGPKDVNMCIKVLDARPSERSRARVMPMVGKYMVQDAKPAGKNKWRGSVSYMGYTLNGTMTMMPDERLMLAGCTYIVVCEELTLIPASPGESAGP